MKVSVVTTSSYKPAFGLRLGKELQEKIIESLDSVSDNYSPSLYNYISAQTHSKIKEIKSFDAGKNYSLNYSELHNSLVLQPLDGLDWYDKKGNYYRIGSSVLIPSKGDGKEFLDEFLSFSKEKYLNIRKKSIDTYLDTSEDFIDLSARQAKNKAAELGSTSGELFLNRFFRKYPEKEDIRYRPGFKVDDYKKQSSFNPNID